MKKVVFFALLPVVLVLFVINYLMVPALNLRSVGLWWNFALAAVTYLVFSGIGTDRENRRRAYHKTTYSPVIISGLALVALLLIIVVLSATGWKIWGGIGYSELIQPVEAYLWTFFYRPIFIFNLTYFFT